MTEDKKNELRAQVVRETIENDRELYSSFWDDALTLRIVLLGVILGGIVLLGVLQ